MRLPALFYFINYHGPSQMQMNDNLFEDGRRTQLFLNCPPEIFEGFNRWGRERPSRG